MDDINQKVSNLSLGTDDLQSDIARWLRTRKGVAYKRSFHAYHSDLVVAEGPYTVVDEDPYTVDEEGPYTIADLKGLLSNLYLLGEPMKNMLYQTDGKGLPRRELCDDETFKDLVLAGDCVKFLMNAWVDIPVSDKKKESKASTRQDKAQRLHNAFHQDFQGMNSHWLDIGFAQYKEMYDGGKHYGKMVLVLQSSGMGKSRTMAEWGKNRPILSICFRDIFGDMQDEPRVGWPPGDKSVCKFFVSPPRPIHSEEIFKGEELAGAFLGAFYTVVADLLQETTLSEPEDLERFYASWTFHDPANVEESPRHKSFAKVCAVAEQRLKDNEIAILASRGVMEANKAQNPSPQRSPETRTTPLTQDQDQGKLSSAQQARSEGMTDWHNSIFDLLAKEGGERLTDICQKFELDFIVVLDECSELDRCNRKNPTDTTSISDMSLLAMQRIIKAGEKHNIWFFLLDTSSGILDLHPRTGPEARSLRLRRDLVPLPPWLYFQYDVMLPRRTRPTTPLEARNIDYLKWYGRPYWSTLRESDLLTAAEEKLLCGKYSLNNLNRAQVLAVFSARLVLELGTDEASTTMAMESVQSHMRILTGFKNSEIITTCAPSEPVLAAAAASLLLKSKSNYEAAMKTLVHSMILQGVVIDKGHRGELIARIILMLARDLAVLKLPNGSHLDHHTPLITLSNFLDALFDATRKNLDKQRPKTPRASLMDWAPSHYLNFTHFIQLSETIDQLSADFLMECWFRGVGLVCSLGQPVFDLLLITYKGSLTEPFDKSLFGLVSIQVKLRADAAVSKIVDGLTCPVVLIEGGDEHRKPDHLVIFMDLGTTTEFRESDEKYSQVSCRQAINPRPTNSTRNWKGYVGEDEPLRYCINIRHHTHSQYPAIGELGTALNELWDEPPPNFTNIANQTEFTLDPLKGKLLKTTESWFEVGDS